MDFCNTPDGERNWMCHFMDHFIIFHILLAVKSKQVKDVVLGLKERVFSVFDLQ